MDVRKLCNSGSSRTVLLGRHCCNESRAPVNSQSSSARQSKLRWMVQLMKFKKDKRKFFQVPYDPYTYSHNFDHGFAWDEPADNFSRSFSVCFSDPNKIFHIKSQV